MQRPAVQFQSPPSGETQLAPGVGTAVAVVDVRVQVLVVAHLGAKLLAAVWGRRRREREGGGTGMRLECFVSAPYQKSQTGLSSGSRL